VVNGKTYYYAVVSYDAGEPNVGSAGLPPSQTTAIIERDLAGNINTDVNTVVVIPGTPAAGYRPAEIQEVAQRISGQGTGTIDVSIVQPNEVVAGQRYQVTFNDTLVFSQNSYSRKTTDYSVFNLTKNELIVDRSTYIGNNDMFPFFDGIGITILNDDIRFLPDESGLISGQSDYSLEVTPDLSGTGPTAGLGGLYPADYEITFFNGIVDTSKGVEFGLSDIPANFTVENITERLIADFIFLDKDNNGTVTSGDEIIPLIPEDLASSQTRFRTTWRIKFVGGSTPPSNGDIFKVSATKPFRSGDVFEFESISEARVEVTAAKTELDRIAVVPNPYIVTNQLEPRTLLTSGRGVRVIQFIHLPQKCTIRIFTLRGQLVDIIEHDGTIADGIESWNLVSKDGIDVSFGVYVYYVEAEGIGTKIGRFAVIK